MIKTRYKIWSKIDHSRNRCGQKQKKKFTMRNLWLVSAAVLLNLSSAQKGTGQYEKDYFVGIVMEQIWEVVSKHKSQPIKLDVDIISGIGYQERDSTLINME